MPLKASRGAASAQGFGQFAQATAANYIEDVFSTRYFHKVELKKVEEDIKIAIYEVVMNWTEVKMMLDY
jgi:hypothetical protein